MRLIFILELLGTVAFAISGALVGIEKKMDIFGVCIMGVTTAVGGGILRDIILGITPPVAFQKPIYVIIAVIVSLIVFLPAVRHKINDGSYALLIADTIGLAIFTMIGVRAAAEYDNHFFRVFLGVLTGVGGGVIRDIFAIQSPAIFVRRVYALACVAGAIVSSYLLGINDNLSLILGAIITFTIRILAAKYKWNLPKA